MDIRPAMAHTVAQSPTLHQQVPSLLNLLYRVGECRWVRVAWEDMIAAIEEINEFIVILASAGLLGCGFLYLLYIPSAIGIQVGKGGVGLEPVSEQRRGGGAVPR